MLCSIYLPAFQSNHLTGYLKFDEFYKIAMWKSARQKHNYLKSKNNIEDKKKSFTANEEKSKIETLCSLRDVGMPTASAILTIAYPSKYVIIDVRCVEIFKN